MPDTKTTERARAAKRAGKAPTTQASEFVKDEIERVRRGEHGVRNTKQAIAIGLSKARRAGVDLPPPPGESERSHKPKAARRASSETSATRSRAASDALKRESSAPVSRRALSKQTEEAASKRPAASRSEAAKKAARTKGATQRSAAAKKAAQTRAARAQHR